MSSYYRSVVFKLAGKSAQEVRIIGGMWKGRKLRFNGNRSLRPTLGRTRETLFNWLRPELKGLHCLDLYAGSGVLGFEALSQGAAHVTFVDTNPRTIHALRDNITAFDAHACCTVQKQDALRYLQRHAQPVDLIFLDPPFDSKGLLEHSVSIIQSRQLATRFVYAEARQAAELASLNSLLNPIAVKNTRAGDAHAVLLELAADDRPS